MFSNKQKFQKYRDKFFDFIKHGFFSITYCSFFIWLITNLPYKNYKTFGILMTMAFSGCFLWILTQLSFIISDYIITTYRTLTQDIEPNSQIITSKIGQFIETRLYFVFAISIIPLAAIIDLIKASVGIVEKLCLKVKKWFKIKK